MRLNYVQDSIYYKGVVGRHLFAQILFRVSQYNVNEYICIASASRCKIKRKQFIIFLVLNNYELPYVGMSHKNHNKRLYSM